MWLTGTKKLIFDYNNFFGSGYFLTYFSDLMDQKMAGAKKVVIIKNKFFHSRQLCEGNSFTPVLYFYNFWPELQMAAITPGDNIFD